ncbi:MAG: Co2+/Mg2+ efflux protein ApaG [Bosea sp. (in: a-proteobacteria)]
MYRAMTRGIVVDVRPDFMPDRSVPAQGQFFWSYTVEIINQSSDVVQLLTRHWVITDAHGKVQEVKGDGVIGQQPKLAPGSTFTYTSGCPLTTPEGTMEGRYGMLSQTGERFEIAIPLFALDSPLVKRTLH